MKPLLSTSKAANNSATCPAPGGLEMQGEAPCGYVAHTKLKAMGGGGGCCSRGLRNRFASFFAPVGAHIGFLSY